jgi:hypothetical protein
LTGRCPDKNQNQQDCKNRKLMLYDKLLVYDDNDNALSITSQGGKG